MVPPSDFQGFHRRLLAGVVKKTEVVKWLMDKEDWDLFLVVFGESHPAGHYFWHFHDPSYLTHPREGAEALRHALREVYVALDRAIGEILQSIDDKTTVFVVSGDGMGPNYSGSHILNDLLTRMGLFNNHDLGDNGKLGEKPAGANQPSQPKTDLLSVIRNMIPERVRNCGYSNVAAPLYTGEAQFALEDCGHFVESNSRFSHRECQRGLRPDQLERTRA